MTFIKNILFLVVCMAVGWGLAKLYLYKRYHPGADFSHYEETLVTGTGDAPGLRGFQIADLPGDFSKRLDQWKDLWATTVGLEYTPSLTRDLLTATAKEAHRHHMAVVLLPPRTFSPKNPYPKPLKEIAADAQAARVDRLCISWLDQGPDAKLWKKEAAAVREAYKGKIILAATPAALPLVTCWDSVDYVGVIGPIQLPRRLPHASDEMDVADFRVAWACKLSEFESIGKLHEMKVALLNFSVPAALSIKLPIPGDPAPQVPVNRELQSKAYEALLIETKGRAALTDIMLMDWAGGDSVAEVPTLLPKVAAAWDPKKPRPPEPVDLPEDEAGAEAEAVKQ